MQEWPHFCFGNRPNLPRLLWPRENSEGWRSKWELYGIGNWNHGGCLAGMVFSFACMGGIGGIGGYGVPKRTSHGIHVREAPSPSLEEGLPLLRACLVPYGIASGQESEGAWRWCGSKLSPPQCRMISYDPISFLEGLFGALLNAPRHLFQAFSTFPSSSQLFLPLLNSSHLFSKPSFRSLSGCFQTPPFRLLLHSIMWRFEIPYTGVRHSKHLLWIWFLLFLRVAFLRARLISSGTCWNIPGPSWPSLRFCAPFLPHPIA